MDKLTDISPQSEVAVGRSKSSRRSAGRQRRKTILAALGLLAVAVVMATLVIDVGSTRSVAITNTVSVPAHRKWNPAFWFANLDDPLPPAQFHPHGWFRLAHWYWQNPLHNFTFYVVGIADRNFDRAGRFPDHVFKPGGGWNWAVCRCGWVRLPFISYENPRFKAYIGWRNRGNFGVKLAFHAGD